MTKQQRVERFLPGGNPRKVRCYDNGGETFDQYTVVFTGNYRHQTGGQFWYLGMSQYPFHPQGFGQHGEHSVQIDKPSYARLGKKIPFDSLSLDAQLCALQTYCNLWDLPLPPKKPSMYVRND